MSEKASGKPAISYEAMTSSKSLLGFFSKEQKEDEDIVEGVAS